MVEKIANEIIHSVKRLQNGSISNAMKKMGVNYGINYGVSIPQLRQLANKHKPDTDLSIYLLNTDIRETKILASMLFDSEKTTTNQLLIISNTIVNLELVEQFSRNVYALHTNLNILLPQLIKRDLWQKLLAIYSAAWCLRINKKCKPCIIEWGIEQINFNMNSESNFMQKATGFLLQSISALNSNYKNQMVELAHKMMKSKKTNVQALAQEFLWLSMA